MPSFNKKYFLLFVALFLIEIFIAVYVHDRIIRPYIGEILVVMLLHCFIKSSVKISVRWCAVAVLVFACMVEPLQYFKMINYFELQNSRLAVMVLGSSFEWLDMLAYSLGIVVVAALETPAVAHN